MGMTVTRKVASSTTLHSEVGAALNEVNLRIIALQYKNHETSILVSNKFEMKLNFGHCISEYFLF